MAPSLQRAFFFLILTINIVTARPITHKNLTKKKQESTTVDVSTIVSIVCMSALFIVVVTMFYCHTSATRILGGPRPPLPEDNITLEPVPPHPPPQASHREAPAPPYTAEPGGGERWLPCIPVSNPAHSNLHDPAGRAQSERLSQSSLEHFAVDVVRPIPAYFPPMRQ